LERTRDIIDQNIIIKDIALVNVTASSCDFNLFAIDLTPQNGGVRQVSAGQILEVVQDNDPSGAKCSVLQNNYGKGYPVWKENNIEVKSAGGERELIVNTSNKGENSITPISANALENTKEVKIKVFKEDRKKLEASEIKLNHLKYVSDFCSSLDELNRILEYINVENPIFCEYRSDVWAFNTEMYNSPKVVRDVKGEISIMIQAKKDEDFFLDFINLEIKGGGGVSFAYDQDLRHNRKSPVMPPDKISNGIVTFKLKVTIGAEVDNSKLKNKVPNLPRDFKLIKGAIGPEVAIYIKFSSDDHCILWAIFEMEPIVIKGTIETVFGEISVGEITISEGVNIKKCLISN
jgi:hypothetical protein